MKKKLSLVAWLAGVLVVGGLLTAVHSLPLELHAPFAKAQPTAQWTVLHALATKCGCSKRVLQHLIERGPRTDVKERVALVDATPKWVEPLERAGFEVVPVDSATLRETYGVEAAPLLVIRKPDGSTAYWGAYAEKRGVAPRDLELLARSQAGETVAPFPLFGCAVSRELQQRSDPLNLKYGAWSK